MISLNTTTEEKKELLRVGLKQLIGLFPIAGPFLQDVLFEFRNNIRQERLNHLVTMLEEAFIKYKINVDSVKTEEALDLIEQTIINVSKARSSSKRIAFKNILISGIINPEKIADCEIFNELLDGLKEEQIQILKEHKKYLFDGQPLLSKLQALNKEYNNEPNGQVYLYQDEEIDTRRKLLNQKTEEVKILLNQYQQKCNAALFNMGLDQYEYFIRDLASKGLLVDQGIGTHDPKPLQYMGITSFGMKFVDFILSD